jgi:hypothetical protein
MAEIGKRESLPKNYVSWLIRLAFLARISSKRSSRGNHSPDLTAQTLITRRIDLPLQWRAQKTALQFLVPCHSILFSSCRPSEIRHEST